MTGRHKRCCRKTCTPYCLPLIIISEGIVSPRQYVGRGDVPMGFMADGGLESAEYNVSEPSTDIIYTTKVHLRS